MVTKHREVVQPAAPRLQNAKGGRRGSGFKTNAEEHHLPLWVGARQCQRIADRVHHAHVGAICTGLQQCATPAAGYSQHVAVTGQYHFRVIADQAYGHVQSAYGQHANGAAGAVDQLDIVRQQVGDTVAEHRVGVAAAKLHQPVLAVGAGLGLQGAGHSAGAFTVAELINVFHG